MVEVCGPGIKASSGKFIVFDGGSSEAREVPTRRVSLSNDDDADAFAWTKVQRLGGSEKPILVQCFDGTHADKIAQRTRFGSCGILMPGLPNVPAFSCGRQSDGEAGATSPSAATPCWTAAHSAVTGDLQFESIASRPSPAAIAEFTDPRWRCTWNPSATHSNVES